MSTRSLWTDVLLNSDYTERDGLLEQTMSFVDACYQRSGSCGLHITFDLSCFRPWNGYDNRDKEVDSCVEEGFLTFKKILEELFKRDQSRWKSFAFYPFPDEREFKFSNPRHYSLDKLSKLLCSAPYLEHVTLIVQRWDQPPGLKLPPTDSFGVAGSALTSLALCGLGWTTERDIITLFPHLKCLCIGSGIKWENIMSKPPTWLKMFPNLEEFVLSSDGGAGEVSYDYSDEAAEKVQCDWVLPVKTLRLIGGIPVFVLRALQLSELETLVIQPFEHENCLWAAAELTFAKAARTLVVQSYTTVRYSDSDHDHICIEQLLDYVHSSNRLPTASLDEIIKENMLYAFEQEFKKPNTTKGVEVSVEQVVTPASKLFEGEVVYNLDIQMFIKMAELFKDMNKSPRQDF
jgi:hypothetical protein